MVPPVDLASGRRQQQNTYAKFSLAHRSRFTITIPAAAINGMIAPTRALFVATKPTWTTLSRDTKTFNIQQVRARATEALAPWGASTPRASVTPRNAQGTRRDLGGIQRLISHEQGQAEAAAPRQQLSDTRKSKPSSYSSAAPTKHAHSLETLFAVSLLSGLGRIVQREQHAGWRRNLATDHQHDYKQPKRLSKRMAGAKRGEQETKFDKGFTRSPEKKNTFVHGVNNTYLHLCWGENKRKLPHSAVWETPQFL